MAQLVIAAAGAAIGGAIAPGVVALGLTGSAIGWGVGSVIGAAFGPKQRSFGPRLDDLKVTGTEYGQAIPWIAGHPRLPGQIWWASERREISTTTEVGKGGGSSYTTYTYVVDVLYGLADVEAAGVSRIWLNGKLIWSSLADATTETLETSATTDQWSRLTVYTGDAAQMPDPTYEAAVTDAPAYRGRLTVFIEGLQLGSSGSLPNLTFEVAQETFPPDETVLLSGDFAGTGAALDTSCDPIGAASVTNGPLSEVYSENGLTFLQDMSAGSFVGKGLGWTDAVLSQGVGKARTIEVLLSVGNSVSVGGSITAPLVVFVLGENVSTNGPTVTLTVDPWNGRARIYLAFVGDSGILSGYERGSLIHFAIVVPTTPSVSTPVRYYLNGVQVWTTTNGGSFINTCDSVFLGGHSGAVPVQFASYVTYKGVRVSIGEVYPGGTTFTPPTSLDSPLCIVTSEVTPATLQSTVEALCARAGMPAGTYDASALAAITKPVRAYALGQVSPARTAIESLMASHYFDAYVTDKLYFVQRSGASALTVDADDLGSGLDAASDELLPITIGSDVEVPAQVAVSYMNADGDYNTATEHSDRLLSGQVTTAQVQIPLALTSSEAKGIADAMVLDGYASRVGGTMALPLSYARLVPSDVVTVPDADGNTYRVRIVRRTDSGPLLEFEWVLDDVTALESAGVTSTDYAPTVVVALPGDTQIALMDIPLLRDADDTLGHYVAATSTGSTWPGASIQRSADGVEYTEAASIGERAVIGTTTTALGSWTGGRVFDETSTVTVSIGLGTLSSSTRSAMLADTSVNAMLVGSEVIRFRTATLVTTGVYTLSGMLRGQRGTEGAMTGHASGERVVLLRTAGLRYVTIDTPSLAVARSYKGVTRGRALDSATAESFTCNGVSLKPWAPVALRVAVEAGGLALSWLRRSRLASTFTGPAGAVVPLGEESESYSVDVVLVSSGATLRTITTTSNEATYSPSQQTADGVSGATAIRFDVYQVSAEVGRGYAASVSTVGSVTPQAQITTLTVGGTFATGAALYAQLGGVQYGHTSVGGDTDLDGIATSLAAVIDAAPAYSASAAGAVVTVTGAVSAAYPVTAGVSAGDNTATWNLTQTASAEVAGVRNELTLTWRNLSDPGGATAYPLGTVFGLLVQRISPQLNLSYSVDSTSTGRTNSTVIPLMAAAMVGASGLADDKAAYGFDVIVDPIDSNNVRVYTPLADPLGWTIDGFSTSSAVTSLVGNSGRGVAPASLRPQIVTLTLAGTPTTGWVYRATLGGVPLEYTATGGDTTMTNIATGLAAAIDAHGDYIASSSGAVITITHASNNVPFTYAATIVASTVTLTAAITQEAA